MAKPKTKLEKLKKEILKTRTAILLMWCDALTKVEDIVIEIEERRSAAEAAYRARRS